MRTIATVIFAVAAMASLGFGPAWADPPAARATIAPWGFDLAGEDPSVSPGADFYDFANGKYVKSLVIPPDRTRYGSFDVLATRSEQRVHDLLAAAAADSSASGEAAKVGAFYRAFMDDDRVEALGARPIERELAEVRAASDKSAIARIMGESQVSFAGSFVDAGITSDFKDPDHYAVYIGQGGLGLPDRDYYLEPSFAAQKAKYQAYVAQMLSLVKWPDAEAQAKAIADLETQIATVSWPLAERRNPVKTYNPMTPEALAAAAPGFDWKAFLEGAEIGGVNRLVVTEDTAIPKIAQVFAATPLETLKAWEAFNIADSAAPYLSKAFADARFDFRGKTLSGQQEQRPRWKRAVSAVDNGLGEAVGRLYVARYFPPESKAKMLELVGNVRAALAARIGAVAWMSDATKAKALEKLSQLTVKIGYPVKWRDYSALKISDDDLAGDAERAGAFEWRRQVARLAKPVDKTEWALTPQTVNAYYNPARNEIVFPAAILQPPFFDPNADSAINYGGIGGVIGHEMTHGFDDQGRQFDGAGKLSDWWTADDAAKFVEQTKRLGAQYSAIEPIPGAHIKGDQTMGENIADLGGVLLALDAYHLSLNGKPAPQVGGLSGDQRVFLGWAQVWRSAVRPDTMRQLLVSDVHSPDPARVNGVFRNVDAWYEAWGVKSGDPLYVAPDQRVRIW